MLGEIKEPKPKLEKEEIEKEEELAEDWLKEENLGKNFPNTFEALKEALVHLQEYISEIKKKYPEELKIFEKFAQEGGLRGILVSPKEKEEKITIFPLKFLEVPERDLVYFRQLRDLAPDFAEKGLNLLSEWAREFFEGNSLKILKEMFRKTEEFLNLKKEKRPTEEIKSELEKLNKLKYSLANLQFAKKIKKELKTEKEIIEAIADFEVFSSIIETGRPIPPIMEEVAVDKEKLVISRKRIKKDLLIKYPVLEEKIINQITKGIIEKRQEKYFEMRKKEGFPTDYAA